MTTRNRAFIVHPALGGLDTTKAPTLLQPDQLAIAENIEYDTSGARKKRLGTARYNATQITSAGSPATFTGIGDFWRHGASLSPTQKFVAHAGTTIYKDDGDGVWDSIKTSWGANNSRTDILIAQGFAVFLNANDAPQKWDQTTVTDLSAGAPNAGFGVYHLRRLWVSGAAASPSRVNYTAASDITDFTGGDTGTFFFDEDDGDRVMGISRPLRGRLYVFKGPTLGSVHEIAGLTPSTFTRNRIIQGAPCVSHRSIITTPNDVFWCSRYGIHSLVATEKYGDVEELFLSRPIQQEYRNLNVSQIQNIVGFWHPWRNIVGWFVPESGQTQNNLCFVYNYVLGLWAIWKFSFTVASCRVMLDPTTQQPRLYLGGYSGYVHSGDQTTLSDDDATVAYTAKIRTPTYVRFGEGLTELQEKQFYGVTTFFTPKSNYNLTLNVTVDGRNQSRTIDLAGGGAVLGDFELDVDVLGGSELTYAESIIEDRGRSILLEYSQGGANQDMEVYGYAIRAFPAEGQAMESS